MNINHHVNIAHIESGDINTLYINIRSIRTKNKINEIENILHTTKYTIHIIIITETWLNKDDAHLFNIPYYHHYYSVRPTRSGGVSIYAHENILSNEIYNICFDSNNILGIKVNVGNRETSIFGIYKQPQSDKSIFLDHLENILSNNKNSYYFGDFNLNILNTTCTHINQYMDIISSTGNIILNNMDLEYVTRISTGTIIDHIITDQLLNKTIINLHDTHISDHRYIHTNIKFNNTPTYQKISSTQINVIEYNKITQAQLSQISDTNTVESFITSINQLTKEHTKTITNTVHNNKRISKPWLSKCTLNCIQKRNHFYKLKIKYPNNSYFTTQFVFYRNKVNFFLKFEKQNYYSSKFNDNINDNKQFWKITNEIIFNKKHCKQQQNITLAIKNTNTNTNDMLEVCNLFNNFFIEVGNTTNQYTRSYPIQLQHNTTSNLYLYPTTPIEISNIIYALNKNSANGYDGVPIKFFRNFANELRKNLSLFINNTFKNGIFPDIFKIAKITPIYKAGNKHDIANYRPISVLPACSKIFEKALLNRLEMFLVNNQIIHKNQFGFVRSSSTIAACTHFLNFVETNIDKHMIVGCFFIDLSKAYDRVNLPLLYEKLERIGIIKKPLELLKSYHNNRYQFVQINNTKCQKQKLTAGVAQGSMISAPEFSIYVNEIFYLRLHGEVQMYADDAIVMFSCKSINELYSKMQEDIITIDNWLNTNFMQINMKKTSYMIFDKYLQNDITFNIILNNTEIKRVYEAKYLGLLIDSKLTWHSHIDKIKNKIRPIMFAIRRLRDFLHPQALKNIYNAHILNHITYLNPIWSCATSTKINELKRLQNKAIKAIYRLPYLYPTRNLYTIENNLLPIDVINQIQLTLLIFKIKNNYIKHNFEIKFRHNTHNYPTSSRFDILLPFCNTNTGLNTILYRGVNIFNNLPENIRNCTSIAIYKKNIIAHFQNLY